MGFIRAAAARRWTGAIPALALLLAVAWTAAPEPTATGAGAHLSAAPVEAAPLMEGLADRAGADTEGPRPGDGGTVDSGAPGGRSGRLLSDPYAGDSPDPDILTRRRLERAGRNAHPGTGPPSPS